MTAAGRALLAQSIAAGAARRNVDMAVEGDVVTLHFTVSANAALAEELATQVRAELTAAFGICDSVVIPIADGYRVGITVRLA